MPGLARLAAPTLRDATRWIAIKGGFQGRTSDGHPGAEVMWDGLQKLDLAIEMYLLYRPGELGAMRDEYPPDTCGQCPTIPRDTVESSVRKALAAPRLPREYVRRESVVRDGKGQWDRECSGGGRRRKRNRGRVSEVGVRRRREQSGLTASIVNQARALRSAFRAIRA